MKFNLLEALKKFLANKNCKPPLETKTIYPRKDPDGDAGACPIKLSTEEDTKERCKSMIEEFNNDPELNKMEEDIMKKITHWKHSGYESQLKKAPNLTKLAESSINCKDRRSGANSCRIL